MTDRQAITSDKVPAAAGPYSSAVLFSSVAFLSGQGPYDADGNLAGDDISSQTRQTLSNLQAVAQASGTSLNNAVKVAVHLSDMANFEAMNAVYAEFFSAPYPARTTVQSGLPKPEMLVEIDAIVALD